MLLSQKQQYYAHSPSLTVLQGLHLPPMAEQKTHTCVLFLLFKNKQNITLWTGLGSLRKIWTIWLTWQCSKHSSPAVHTHTHTHTHTKKWRFSPQFPAQKTSWCFKFSSWEGNCSDKKKAVDLSDNQKSSSVQMGALILPASTFPPTPNPHHHPIHPPSLPQWTSHINTPSITFSSSLGL